MKKKLLKIGLVLTLCGIIFMILSTTKADTIKEDVKQYTDDIYLIGATRFDANTVITATRAAKAGVNQAKLNMSMGKDLSNVELTTYYYDSLFNDWYELRGDNFELLTEAEKKNVEDNLYIFFVNNVEKTHEFKYSGKVDDNSLTKGVTYDGTKFIVPSTQFKFSFKSNGIEQTVMTETTNINNKVEIKYGEFYIPVHIDIYDETGTEKILTSQVKKDGYIDTMELSKLEKDGYQLNYLDEEGNIIDLATKKITTNCKIYAKWIPIGKLLANDSTYNNLTLTYNGTIPLDEENKNKINVKLYAPDNDYDTSNTTIKGIDGSFDSLKNDENYVEIPLVFENKDEVKEIEVTWKQGVTTKFKVVLGKNAKIEREVKWYKRGNKVLLNTQKVIEGEKLVQEAPEVSGYIFMGWTTEIDTTIDSPIYDITKGATSNIILYPVYKKLPTSTFATTVPNVKLGESVVYTSTIDAQNYANENLTLSLDITSEADDSTPIEYDSNNYIQMLVDGEWKNAKDIPITLKEDKNENKIQMKILITDKIQSNNKFKIVYTYKKNGETLYRYVTKNTSPKVFAEEDIVIKSENNYYGSISEIARVNGEFVLQKDIEIGKTSLVAKNITLDLNGHTITGTKDADIFYITRACNLKIKNGNIIASGTGSAVYMGTTSTTNGNINVTVENNVKIISDNYGIFIQGKNNTLNFKGKIELKNNGFAISGNGTVKGQNTIININEGSEIVANKGLAFYLPQAGELNILGGKITANTAIAVKSGKVNISGGTIKATGEKRSAEETNNGTQLTGDIIYAEVNDNYEKNISINITDGTLSSTNANIIQVYKSNSTDDVIVNSSYTPITDPSNAKIVTYN